MGAGMVALHDIPSAVAEIERAAGLGLVAIFVRPNPIRGRNLDDPAYEPIYDALEDTGLPLVTQKSELEAAVTELDADIKLAKIEQVQSKYQNDGTKMADVKERLTNLRKRIEIQREKLNLAKQIEKTGVENKSVDEIMAELDSKDKTVEVSKK